MELFLVRDKFTDESTIGKLILEDGRSWETLEDVDRGLDDSMPVEEILKLKIQDVTCIPYGKYEVVVDFSVHFGKLLPHILNTKGFAGVRIHAGNTAKDTEGCVLLGKMRGENFIGESVIAFNEFFPILWNALKKEPCYISITKSVV